MIRNPWVVGVFTSLMATVMTAWAAKMVPADGLSPLWQKYWPEILGVVVGVLWLGGYGLWLRSRRLADRFDTLARQASDSHIGTVVYKILADEAVNQKIAEHEGRIRRLEEWQRKGGGDTAETFARRVLETDPQRGGMDVKP